MTVSDDQGALSEDECRRLLDTRVIGRVGLTERALPAIVPVRISVVEDSIVLEEVFAGDPPLSTGSVAALEVDSLEPDGGPSWVVEVRGILEELPGTCAGRPRRVLSTRGISGWRCSMTTARTVAAPGGEGARW